MTTMTTIAMDAEIAYRQDKVRGDYRRAATPTKHSDRTETPIWRGRRHRADARKSVDLV